MLALDEVIRKESLFQKENAKVNQILDGDRNTKFFHMMVRIEQANNLISTLKINCVLSHDQDIMCNHVVSPIQ